ncbi:unnamed protein product [Caenorhabditis bovis]|uniref:Uncharacterized protein n=1 Tax=Caenorhabditis bovis TaxID=2654633 RepID=A0A8S1F3W7_9PELO|nr:unnamed protein product [Caenorhabditis bovis]
MMPSLIVNNDFRVESEDTDDVKRRDPVTQTLIDNNHPIQTVQLSLTELLDDARIDAADDGDALVIADESLPIDNNSTLDGEESDDVIAAESDDDVDVIPCEPTMELAIQRKRKSASSDSMKLKRCCPLIYSTSCPSTSSDDVDSSPPSASPPADDSTDLDEEYSPPNDDVDKEHPLIETLKPPAKEP